MKGVPKLPVEMVSRVWSEVRGFLFDTFRAFIDDHAMRMAAALAFYTTFSVTPALLIGMSIAAAVVGSSKAESELTERIGQMINPEAAEYLFSLLKGLGTQLTSRHLPIIGFVSAIVAATAVFAELQTALNSVWHATSQSGNGIVSMMRMRLKAFVFVVSIGVLLLASVVTGTVLATLNAVFAKTVPIPPTLLGTLEPLIQFGILPVLLASTYKLVPDVDIAWKDVVLAAVVTALLFLLGKSLFGMYLRLSIVGSLYGAAGSLVIVLAWVYYSAQVFFLGAEMSKVFAQRYGSHAGKLRHQEDNRDEESATPESQ
jgi:membrane protein